MRGTDWASRALDDELGEALRLELPSWPGVALRPMMGTLAYFHGRQMLGCYVNRAVAKKKPAWLNWPDEPCYVCIRLRAEDAERALERSGVAPPRLGFKNWVEVELASRRALEEAVRWLGQAYEHPPRRTPQRRRKRG